MRKVVFVLAGVTALGMTHPLWRAAGALSTTMRQIPTRARSVCAAMITIAKPRLPTTEITKPASTGPSAEPAP